MNKTNIISIISRLKLLVRVLTIFVFFTLNVSCAQSPESLIQGACALHEIYLDGNDIQDSLVYTNLVSFGENNALNTPHIGERLSKSEMRGSWYVDNDLNQITLSCGNPYFNGTFDICFKWHKPKAEGQVLI